MQDSSVGGTTKNNCLCFVHTEGGVQVRVQEEVGREEQDEGETHEEQTLNRSSWMACIWGDARMQTLEPCGVIHIIRRVQCA